MEKIKVAKIAEKYNLHFMARDFSGHEDNVGQKFFVPFMEALGYDHNKDIDAKPQIKHQIVKNVREPDFGIYQYDTYSRGQAMFGIVADVKRYGRNLTEDMVEKLAGYCVLTGALYGILTNGQSAVFIRPEKGAVDWEYIDSIPTKEQLIEELESEEVEYDEDEIAFAKRTVHELDEETIEEIAGKCHDIIRSQEGMAVPKRLYEFSKLIVSRIVDERRYRRDEQDQLLITEKNVREMEDRRQDIHDYIQQILASIRDEIGIFSEGESVDLNKDLLKEIIGYLDEYPLWSENMDVLGHVYEKFLMNTMTGRELGGYFTPRPVVDTIVEMIDPSLNETVFDPACGSGGFLISPLIHLKGKHNLEGGQIKRASQKFGGIDLFPVIQKLSQINLWLHGDCHNNIHQANSLLLNEKTPDIVSKALKNPEANGFDIIFTNPPYGAKEGNKLSKKWLKNASETWQSEGYNLFESAFGRDGNPISLQPQVPFLELCIKLLKKSDDLEETGRMGIVLDNGILSNTVEEAPVIRNLIKEYAVVEAVIGLPKGTFYAYGSNVIPVFVLLRRQAEGEENKSRPIFRAEAKKVGLKPGETKYKKDSKEDLEKIVEFWKEWDGEQEEDLRVLDEELPIWSTKGWDYRIDNNYFSPARFIAEEKLQEMKDKYHIKTLDDVSKDITSGKSPSSGGDVPLLEGGNILPNHIDPHIKKWTSEYVDEEKENPYISPHDLIVVQDGSPGRFTSVAEILIEERGDIMVSNHCYLIKIKEEYRTHSAFISTFLNSRIGQALVRKYVAGSVSPTIRDDEINSLKIPIPKDEETSKSYKERIEELQKSVLMADKFLTPSKDIEEKLSGDRKLPGLPVNWYPSGNTPSKYEY